ncbi:MAG TPA: DMT family transporter [Dictyoglomaceae bacterium]|nr:DMT family transporter [Dictyoglomaceae bacterium]HOL38984.1 DMT family transporter [Dictyoglomaceae bacterium]HPP15840.1 DMT family transporter [Dictyoglomaceae bacterium]HPU42829.1 DMT family transporter [Dictyoglomaceae bacterium]
MEEKLKEKSRAYLLLFIAVIAMGSASLIIKLTSAPPLIIATYRLLISSVILLFLNGRKIEHVKSSLPFLMISGLCLGIHFYSWISALFLTSVANAVVLVNTSPIFIAIFSFIFEKKSPSKKFFLSFVFAILGIVLITKSGLTLKIGKGEILSIIGAITFAIYLYMGRYISDDISVSTYITSVYFISGVILLFASLFLGLPFTGYTLDTYIKFLLLALVPQLIGHSLANYAIRVLPPTSTSIVLIGETVIATIFAVIFLHESINSYQLLGMFMIIISILYSASEEK